MTDNPGYISTRETAELLNINPRWVVELGR